MSYAGHVLDMINRLKQNREIIKLQRDRMKDLRKEYVLHMHKSGHAIHDPDIPPEILEKIKSDIRNKIRKRRRKAFILTVLFYSVVVIGILYLVFQKFM